MLDTLARPIPAAPTRPLKPVERAVLLRLARGHTYDQIAAREHLTRSHVIEHVTNLHAVFEVATSAYTVALAHRAGLLPLERYARPVLNARAGRILELIGAGLLNREIAPVIDTDVKTTSNAVTRLYRDLGASNRPHAVHIGWCTGLLGAGVSA